ncbi:cobalt import ATP-binding protein CbiO 1 [Acidaminococcus sp. CAG:917]|mgnify:CR=1 FL=1|nr:cobalt import ATP-binding protein CbiO 1 [Acidaminococcus sp. CAG:917]
MAVVEVKNLSFTYSKKTPYQTHALTDVSFSIEEGEVFGIVGATGSGKSTLISHLNVLTKIQSGDISVLGLSVKEKKNLKSIRFGVGMVFQYPEYQLFEDTVEKDVAFGPKNMKLEKEEIDRRVKEALNLVGLDYDVYAKRSPFELSGGEKRRVAIAGVIAMEPKILVLDEVAAGLDPEGREDILKLIKKLQKEKCPTVILISHNMDDIAYLADRILVLSKGKAEFLGTPKEVFANYDRMNELKLGVPLATRIQKKLEAKGMRFSEVCVTAEQLAIELKKMNAKEADNV